MVNIKESATKARDLEVHELHCHHRIAEQTVVDELVLDHICKFPPCHAGNLELAEHRKVDIAFIINHITHQALVVAARRHHLRSGLIAHYRKVEHRHKLRIAA